MYSKRMQVQALCDRLAGLFTTAKERDFDEPYLTIWRALDQDPDSDAETVLKSLGLHNPWIKPALEEVMAAQPGTGLPSFPSVSDLRSEYKPITWLWEGWIPRGMITLLGSVPGTGKSIAAMDLTRRLLAGESFPDGRPNTAKRPRVVYLDTEAVFHLQYERVRNFNIDISRLYLPHLTANEQIDLSRERWRRMLAEMICSIRPSLLVIDSLSTPHSDGENEVENLRGLPDFFNHLAQDYDMALLIIYHLRKAPGQLFVQLDMEDFRGSTQITSRASSVLGLSIVQTGPQPDRKGPRRLELIRTKLGMYPKPLGFVFVSGEDQKVNLLWGEPASEYVPRSFARNYCTEWLVDLLAEYGPLPPSVIVKYGAKAGFSRSAIYMARNRLEGWVISGLDELRQPVWKLVLPTPGSGEHPLM